MWSDYGKYILKAPVSGGKPDAGWDFCWAARKIMTGRRISYIDGAIEMEDVEVSGEKIEFSENA